MTSAQRSAERTLEATAITDCSGYEITARDLDFLRIQRDGVVLWLQRRAPLGMNAKTYKEVIRRLVHALEREVLDGRNARQDADVRLQGSSVRFFSNRTKPMCFSREAIAAEFLAQDRDQSMPVSLDVERVKNTLEEQWPECSPRPLQRPFDVMYRVGIHVEPSDYDVQISSRVLVDIVRNELRFESLNPELFDYVNPSYAFIKKRLVASCLRYLWAWSEIATHLTGRPVNLAVFDDGGPPRIGPTPNDPNPVSSHFQ